MINRIISLLLIAMTLFSCLVGCGKTADDGIAPGHIPSDAPSYDADAFHITEKGSYTADSRDIVPDTVVASIGSKHLTLGQLQIYYWLEAAAYCQTNPDQGPDFSRPLDAQPCDIDHSVNNWQQYFLREALTAWQTHQALILHAARTKLPTEKAWQPNPEQYAEYMPEVPALQYLYGYRDHYQPNELHQAYLDSLPETLSSLAADLGLADADALAESIGSSRADLLAYANDLNLAYMYFTELMYQIHLTEREITAYYDSRSEVFAAGGILRNDEKTVNIRHILLVPEGGVQNTDGTVTADANSWDACLTRAEEILEEWNTAVQTTRYANVTTSNYPEARFSELARQYSADAGSAPNGGLYQNLHPGQLTGVLDRWCFDTARQPGDSTILQSPLGYHILFFSGSVENWYSAAEAALIRELSSRQLQAVRTVFPMTVDYAAIRLVQPEDPFLAVSPSDLLYPDVAHQRFPSIPLYIQQDYPDTKYGRYDLSTHGCGICVLAMAASYLTDQEITPPELAARYGYYCGDRGSETVLMEDTPAELGFHMVKVSSLQTEIDEALKNGQPVASLQMPGYWTQGGHFILIADITEEGNYVVRDSNLLNYNRILAFSEDCHTWGSLIAAGQFFWIFDKKVTTISACARCGGGEAREVPDGLFLKEYHCEKCMTAMHRRDIYLSSPAG